MAVDSITRTLEANVPQVQRLKILIHGQEVETLAGHLDLTGDVPGEYQGELQVAPAVAAPGLHRARTNRRRRPRANLLLRRQRNQAVPWAREH